MAGRQKIILGDNAHTELKEIFKELGTKKYLLICGKTFDTLPVSFYIAELGIPFARFGNYSPNPTYEQALEALKMYREEGCDAIFAVGGGSPMDVAKCVKMFAGMEEGVDYWNAPLSDSGIPLIALPTTAGTGSESTRYAVITKDGKKQSLTHESLVPNIALLEPRAIKGSPDYLKKCAVMDAVCQSVEAWWAIASDRPSIAFAKKSLELILPSLRLYLRDSDVGNSRVLMGANFSGRAINIARTTAAHSMSYNLTTEYGVPHGHAVALCLPRIWEYMLAHPEKTADARGAEYLFEVFQSIAETLKQPDAASAIKWFDDTLKDMGLLPPALKDPSDIERFAGNVNPERLTNNPVHLDKAALEEIYTNIFRMG
ncbi:MAG: phosphonoacetaldehyde reductase [Firmicutes bacterium]|nr:phosphonoacetaldehyde reductase [Bacillota bacterium]